MKIGASQHHLGLTVRWRPECCAEYITLWRGGDVMGTVHRENGEWRCSGPDGELAMRPDHRWQAKRAVEALVGQWWREKCEREAMAAAYKRRVLAAFRGENHGADDFDVRARVVAEHMHACQDAIGKVIDSLSPAKATGEDLRALLDMCGVGLQVDE